MPLAVVRRPMPSQSSITVTPGASRGTYATCSLSSTARARTGIQSAKRAPVLQRRRTDSVPRAARDLHEAFVRRARHFGGTLPA
ncbi:hypothetical protein GCM10010121_046820 [Streptomyces brasiliensis]|uniref:Uncharacterized protein n=1 Tax=Streptomyces brasiliensis TaxID=1954 RepID=A0A917NUN2_9ACTN|nr:hypothetical protein GCM10010121_046820 [Streptomyces brasiliensis]